MSTGLPPSVGRLNLLVVLFLSTLPSQAFAQDAVSKAIDKIVDLLTSEWAYGAAVIAVAIVGYRMLKGYMKFETAGWTIGGIIVIFGAATIVDMVTK
jgi:type IV secretion system protein VirB2